MQIKPHQTKFKKNFRARPTPRVSSVLAYSYNSVKILGLQALEFGLIPAVQLQAIKFCISKKIKKIGTCVFSSFPHFSKTIKTSGGRMGKGKGNEKVWVCSIQAGFFICKIKIFSKQIGIAALLEACRRLSLKTKIISL